MGLVCYHRTIDGSRQFLGNFCEQVLNMRVLQVYVREPAASPSIFLKIHANPAGRFQEPAHSSAFFNNAPQALYGAN